MSFTPSTRYPDPAVEVLHDSFLGLRLFSASVEQLHTGCRWSEGPVWFGDGRYLLWSDIPNDRILRWDDASGAVSVFRQPSNFANGLARDRQGRLLACEHLTRRVTRTEYDGSITVLADRWQGMRLNSPNDIVCSSDGAVWFTDPLFGISGHWEGEPAASETPWAVYRIDPASGELQRVIDEEINPGIASHSGVITLNRVNGNTIYITMGGGCQGCAASSVTLRSGVEGSFRKEVPQLGAVLDETDHQSGVNPFFREMPAGMGM